MRRARLGTGDVHQQSLLVSSTSITTADPRLARARVALTPGSVFIRPEPRSNRKIAFVGAKPVAALQVYRHRRVIRTLLPSTAARLREAGCVFAEEEASLLLAAARTADELVASVDRRTAGEPLEQILGWAEFAGLRVLVDPGVFVPRRRSELLVQRAVERTPTDGLVVDLCCGSGALGAAVLAAHPGIRLHAADIDPIAVRCARRNLPQRCAVHVGDLFEALPSALRGRVDVLLANVPYVPTAAIPALPAEARLHEPLDAVDGGPTGLRHISRVAVGAREWLVPGGSVLVECSERQADPVRGLFRSAGLAPIAVTAADLGATVVIGRRRSE